jgi:hypothetical protein
VRGFAALGDKHPPASIEQRDADDDLPVHGANPRGTLGL